MKKLFLALTVALLSIGCSNDPISTENVGSGINLELLFEHDGCKIYRFRDGGRSVYWSDCSGKTSYEYRTSNGKGGGSTHQVETISN